MSDNITGLHYMTARPFPERGSMAVQSTRPGVRHLVAWVLALG
jgi:hypothetical protein